MRIASTGNLTVDLIRAQRFDVACHDEHFAKRDACLQRDTRELHTHCATVDRVDLSREALAYDATDFHSPLRPEATRQPVSATEALATPPPDRLTVEPEPKRLTPVVGSPALSGLGVALIVPGTLLDVVA
jgi:hypothetical protein